MKTTVNLYDFREAFRRMDRMSNFSYEGLEVLFDGLEEYEEDTGEQVELDVIALCCEYSEESYADIIGDYCTDITEELPEDASEEDQIEYIRGWLENETTVIGEPSEGVFLFQQF